MFEQKQKQSGPLSQRTLEMLKGFSEFNVDNIRKSIEELKSMRKGTYFDECLCHAGSKEAEEFMKYFESMTKIKK